jgi:hypothetical protein
MMTDRPVNQLRLLSTLVFAVLLLATSPSLLAEYEWDGVPRIVAVGDVHGDHDNFVEILRAAGVIDPKNRWIAGTAHLVQIGDILDRGSDSRKVMDLLMKLEEQAAKAKGRVHVLLGNHETMNLYGDLRYVSPGEYKAFRTSRSAELREILINTVLEERKQDGMEFPDEEALKERWRAEYPLGWVEHRQAFAPKGKYGKWLREKNVAIKINDILFVHGGISPKYLSLSLEELNEAVREELRDTHKLENGMVKDPEGPLWYRGLSQEPESEAAREHVDNLLARHEVRHVVVGHTTTFAAVLPRFKGKVVVIDVGLSKDYGGPLACLLVNQSKLEVLHGGKTLAFPTGDADFTSYVEAVAAMDPEPSRTRELITKFFEAPVAADN